MASGIWWHGVEGMEPDVTGALLQLLPATKHFVDVGSNIGVYSVLARKLNPSISVYAFEPVPEIFAKNVEFHRANACDASAVRQIALGREVGSATIVLPLRDGSSEEETTATLRPDSWQAKSTRKLMIRVQVTTLDAFLSAHSVQAPLLIKIDVEDFEAAVLWGARETIAKYKPVIICEILSREHGNQETLGLLKEIGYRAFAMTRDGYFRVEARDFVDRRNFMNFILVPEGASRRIGCYLPLDRILTLVPPCP